MIRWLLRKLGYYRIDYGVSCGRHWMSIDGKVVAQTSGDHVWLRDEDVHQLVYHTVDRGRYFSNPRAYMPFMGDRHDSPTHVERLMYVSKMMRAEHPTDQRANWIDDAVHFLERETKLIPSKISSSAGGNERA
jgi:hypothetical protein